MARLITIKDHVQPWLESTKLTLEPDDILDEEPIASELVRSKLSSRLDVSTWVDVSTTPTLVKQMIGMLVAAWRYNKHYSESDEDAGNPYANKLERMVLGTPPDFEDGLIYDILNGTIDLLDVTEDLTETGTIAFYPDDTVGVEYPEEAARFTMGTIF